MNIRPKLIISEIALSIVLFFAVLFSISSFVKFIEFENLKIKIASLQDSASQLRFSVIGMTAKNEPTDFLIQEYQLLSNNMEEDLQTIASDPLFKELPAGAEEYFIEAQTTWENTRNSLSLETIVSHLNLRNQFYSTTPLSLAETLALTINNPNVDQNLRTALISADRDLRRLERDRYRAFETELDRTMLYLEKAAEDFRRNQFRLAIGVPALVLLVMLFGIHSFASQMSTNLQKLADALAEIAGGDFSTRVDMQTKDEFSSLASSINAFTRTLGAKLESFRHIMHEIGQTLNEGVDTSLVEKTLLNLALRDTVGDGAALYKVGGEAGELILSQALGKFRPPFPVEELPDHPDEDDVIAFLHSRIIRPGETILGESAKNGESRMIRNSQFAYGIDWARDVAHPLHIASLMVLPLQVGSTVFGVLVVSSTRNGRFFSDLEFANMQSFAELAAITLDNILKYADILEASQLNRELGIAEEIQNDLLPKKLPLLPGGEVGYLSRRIKGLNGDYFDVFPLGGGKSIISVCEVAGRGVPAGLVMVMIRTILRLVTHPGSEALDVMHLLNRDMTQNIAIENYASVSILIMNKDGEYTYCSAAHHPLQVFHQDMGEYESIRLKGIPVGIDPKASYEQEKGTLKPGDLVLFHTDGVPESRSRTGDQFGMTGLLDLVAQEAQKSPPTIMNQLKAELEFFERGTQQNDDQTVVVLKYKGEGAA